MYPEDFDFECPSECPFRQNNPYAPPPYQDGPGPGAPPKGPGPKKTGHPKKMGPPTYPPPSVSPKKMTPDTSMKAVDPGALRPCTYRYVYIWLRNGRSFWAWLNYVGRRSASGWRWNGSFWVYFGIDLRRIDSFVCR